MHQESKFDVLCPGIAQNINLTKQPDHETNKKKSLNTAKEAVEKQNRTLHYLLMQWKNGYSFHDAYELSWKHKLRKKNSDKFWSMWTNKNARINCVNGI